MLSNHPMRQRIVVGLLALPAALIPIWLGGVWSALLLVLVGIGAGLEFYRLLQIGGYHPSRALGLSWLVMLIGAYVWPDALPLSLVIMAGLIVCLVEAMFQKQEPMHTWMATSMGALYLGTMLGQALALRYLPNGLWWLLFALAMTWVSDSAAYFTGVTIGRHKLWPRLSPKKTWEGTVAGWIAAALAGAVWIAITPLSATHTWVYGMVVGACSGMLALLGDLSISTLKRQVGVKDSGHFMPGHGGLLDRLDSLLFVVPFVYQIVLIWR
jgi:phosphatidate cytidylyltransferase